MDETQEGSYETGLGWKLEITSSSSDDFDPVIAEHIMGLTPGVDFGNLGEHQWESNEYSEYNQFICSKCGTVSQDWVNEIEDISPTIRARPCYKAPDHYSNFLLSAYEALQRLIADADANVDIEYRSWSDWGVEIITSPEPPSVQRIKGYAWHPNLATAIAGAMVSWIEHKRTP